MTTSATPLGVTFGSLGVLGTPAIIDVANGVTDVAFVWGPLAGFHAQEVDTELTIKPLVYEDSLTRLTFRVSMAVRYNETDWKHEINGVLDKLQPEINEILTEYKVPLLDEKGLPLTLVE